MLWEWWRIQQRLVEQECATPVLEGRSACRFSFQPIASVLVFWQFYKPHWFPPVLARSKIFMIHLQSAAVAGAHQNVRSKYNWVEQLRAEVGTKSWKGLALVVHPWSRVIQFLGTTTSQDLKRGPGAFLQYSCASTVEAILRNFQQRTAINCDTCAYFESFMLSQFCCHKVQTFL